ncbi:hypothetical protein [Mycolicibacterium mengxianglii]|uniref:hypothetical protein n=1 Tax=Mycolicibacterium mengxianglii TaxID=2736649 RepID=UPI0018D18473|nr:hypothetical protein [Mycolicibacterium mengxianglii]
MSDIACGLIADGYVQAAATFETRRAMRLVLARITGDHDEANGILADIAGCQGCTGRYLASAAPLAAAMLVEMAGDTPTAAQLIERKLGSS